MPDTGNMTVQEDLAVPVHEDPELDQLIATFPEQTASFLMKLRQEQTRTGIKPEGKGSRKSTDTTVPRKCRVILPQTETGEATFYGKTTYQNFFGNDPSKHTEPSLRFGEMPVFTDSILYPGQQRRLQSTTHETFVSKPIHMVEQAKPVPPTLRMEGERYLETTNRSVFTKKVMDTGTHRHLRTNAKDRVPAEQQTRIRNPFVGETQFRADFPAARAWTSVQPETACAPPMIVPPQSEILLRDSDVHEFRTEQRDQFVPRDVQIFPVPKSCKKEVPAYTRPEIKFTDTTVTKSDFPAYTLSQLREANPRKALCSQTTDVNPAQTELSEREAELLKAYLTELVTTRQTKLPRS
ncbi:unnamed protein product [Echinostoma caproni]|uniref:Muscular LMNA-interacting protein n=1 Tax=Echinostoma caproni TaxID=27848 RepID=A0A183APT7_9TREM|nr:unnamed protein product [Echinostoma caproni]